MLDKESDSGLTVAGKSGGWMGIMLAICLILIGIAIAAVIGAVCFAVLFAIALIVFILAIVFSIASKIFGALLEWFGNAGKKIWGWLMKRQQKPEAA